MSERLSKEREAELQQRVEWGMGFPGATAAVGELLVELDAVRAERDAARSELGFARDRVRILTDRLNARDDAYDADIAQAREEGRRKTREELRLHSDELWEAHAQGDVPRISSAIYDLRQEFRKG